MNKETQSIIKNLENILTGEPWFGRAVFIIMDEVGDDKANIKPNNTEHSLNELLWHMITWAEFTLANLENKKPDELAVIEANDWRVINPKIHTWKKGLTELKSIHKKIADILNTKEDTFLKEMVPNRRYNFRFMLNGLIQHNIYHLGQIAYIKKLLG